jgi:DNA repair ATPase RecN
MNKKRRTELREVISKLDDCRTAIDMILSEEADCLGNMPENLEYSEQYEKMEEVVDNLEEALDEIDSVIDSLESAVR